MRSFAEPICMGTFGAMASRVVRGALEAIFVGVRNGSTLYSTYVNKPHLVAVLDIGVLIDALWLGSFGGQSNDQGCGAFVVAKAGWTPKLDEELPQYSDPRTWIFFTLCGLMPDYVDFL